MVERLACCMILLLVLTMSTRSLAKKPPAFRVAFSAEGAAWVEPFSAKAVTEPLMDEIVRKGGATYSLDVFQRTSELMGKLLSGKYNAVISSPLQYVQISQKLKTIPISKYFASGKSSFRVQVLVARSSGISSLNGLKGKKISIHEIDPIKRIYLQVALARKGIKNYRLFFSSIHKKKKEKASVLELFLGDVDACVVSDTVFGAMSGLNPQIKEKLKILESSGEIAHGLIFVRADMPEKDQRLLSRQLVKLHESKIGRQTLAIFKTTKMVPARESDYDYLRELYNEYKTFFANGS